MLQPPLLCGFPSSEGSPVVRALPGAHDLHLHRATDADLPFMRELYGQLRAEELRQTGWPQETQRLFLDSQFTLQHKHFTTYYATADFWRVDYQGNAAGRFYLQRAQPDFHIIDIALIPAWRGIGIGSALIGWAKTQAIDGGAEGISLHVDRHNPAAQRLYQALGFVFVKAAATPTHLSMRWSRDIALS